MVVGSIVFATKSGLGVLARLLYDSKIIDKVFIVQHKKFSANENWYNKNDIYVDIDKFIDDIDSLLIIEAPLIGQLTDWEIVKRAHTLGKKVVLMPMYESTPRKFIDPSYIDFVICPSKLDFDEYSYWHRNCIYIPIPSSNKVKWKRREFANLFIHNVGHGGIFSRNGTEELIKSLPYIKSKDFRLEIRVQPDADENLINYIKSISDNRVKVLVKNFSDEELWERGDVFIFPEKFNGLSLPLQEAFASGMAIMAGDRYPINTWLPSKTLIKIDSFHNIEIPWASLTVKSANILPKDIAKKIDEICGKDISELSDMGKVYLDFNAGSLLKERYDEILRSF